VSDGTGTAYIFVRNGLELDAFELDVSNSDNGVIQFVSVNLLNPKLPGSPIATSTAGTANFLGIAIDGVGLDSQFAATTENVAG